jgi:hypothetical protein
MVIIPGTDSYVDSRGLAEQGTAGGGKTSFYKLFFQNCRIVFAR